MFPTCSAFILRHNMLIVKLTTYVCIYSLHKPCYTYVQWSSPQKKDRRGPDTSADSRSTNAEAVTASTDVYTYDILKLNDNRT